MTFLKKYCTYLLLLSGLTLVYACSKKTDIEKEEKTDNNSKNRRLILENIADQIVLPAYAYFKVSVDSLVGKSNAFTSKPNKTTLLALRDAWSTAYINWQKVELFDFGPGQTEAIRNYLNIYPANVAGIESNIQSENTVNLEFSNAIATQGFPALDYLINGLATDDAAILSAYTSAQDAAKRLEYLKKLVLRINQLTNKVNSDWIAYKTSFINNSGTDAGSSLALVVNSYVLNYERFIRSGKFGIPTGIMNNGVPAPEKVEAVYKKDLAIVLARTAQQASTDFFEGKAFKTYIQGPSIKSYLDALGAKDKTSGIMLSTAILNQFNASGTKLSLLSVNLYNDIVFNNQKVMDVYAEMQKSVKLLKVDMTSALSITITYTDNDGD